MYHEDIFYPFLPMFSTFDGKMVNVVENAECFCMSMKHMVEDLNDGTYIVMLCEVVELFNS